MTDNTPKVWKNNSPGMIRYLVRTIAHELEMQFRISKRNVPYAVWTDGTFRLNIAWFEKGKFYRAFTSSIHHPKQARHDFTDKELLKVFALGYMGKELTEEYNKL